MPPRLNIPPITRILLSALGAQSLINSAIRYTQWQPTSNENILVPYLQLVPQLSLFYPWTFVGTSLVENNVVMLGISGVILFYAGRYLERAWTSREFAKFLLVTTLIPNILTFLLLIFVYALTADIQWT